MQEIVDDYTFECEVGGQAQRTKVSIFQSMGDPLVYGKIYCAKEPKAEEDSTDLKLIHPPYGLFHYTYLNLKCHSLFIMVSSLSFTASSLAQRWMQTGESPCLHLLRS